MTSAIFLPLSPASNFPFPNVHPRPAVSVLSYAPGLRDIQQRTSSIEAGWISRNVPRTFSGSPGNRARGGGRAPFVRPAARNKNRAAASIAFLGGATAMSRTCERDVVSHIARGRAGPSTLGTAEDDERAVTYINVKVIGVGHVRK